MIRVWTQMHPIFAWMHIFSTGTASLESTLLVDELTNCIPYDTSQQMKKKNRETIMSTNIAVPKLKIVCKNELYLKQTHYCSFFLLGTQNYCF